MRIEELYQKFLSSTGVTTDTRNIATGNIFFALKGEKFNANQFAAEALEHGAAYVVIDEPAIKERHAKFGDRLILADNVLKTLQELAGYHRDQLKCPVLAITGSNGKTTTKELVAAVLAKQYNTFATKGNLNNHIGIPLTLLSIKTEAEFAVIEMGANHVGEIASYCEYVKPGFGLITNVGLAHTEGFGGFEGVVKGKTELYKYVETHAGAIFVCSEHEILRSKITESTKVVLYGKAPEAYCRGQLQEGNGTLLAVTVKEADKETTIQTKLIGAYNFDNVMAAICIGKYFGVEMSGIKSAIEDYVPSNNRSQQITYGSNTVILDAYNANPSSMIEALKNFDQIKSANKAVILGEMMELGDLSEQEHEKIAAMVKKMQLLRRIFTGTGFAFLKGEPGIDYFADTAALKQWFAQQKFENALLLVKGSRKNELEKLFN